MHEACTWYRDKHAGKTLKYTKFYKVNLVCKIEWALCETDWQIFSKLNIEFLCHTGLPPQEMNPNELKMSHQSNKNLHVPIHSYSVSHSQR